MWIFSATRLRDNYITPLRKQRAIDVGLIDDTDGYKRNTFSYINGETLNAHAQVESLINKLSQRSTKVRASGHP